MKHALMVIAIPYDDAETAAASERVREAQRGIVFRTGMLGVDVDAGEALQKLSADDIIEQFGKPLFHHIKHRLPK